MAGFNLPIQAIPPQLLAEMARGAFRPPALMSGGGGGGGGGMQMPQAQGFNVGQGMDGMGQGLGMLAGQLGKGPGIDDRTRAIDAEIADWSKYGTPEQPQPGWFSRNFGGGRADGGPVMPGQHYTVGERGPETFVPAVPGHIVPDWQGARTIPDGTAPEWQGARTIPDPTDWAPSKQRIMDWERDFFGGRKLRR